MLFQTYAAIHII